MTDAVTLSAADIRRFYFFSFFFLMIEGVVIYKEILPAFLLPVALFFLFLAFYRLDYFYFSMVFFTPLSIPLQEFMPDLSFNLSIPSELFILLILFVMLYRYLSGKGIDRAFLFHPLTLAVLIYLSWILVTAVTSTLPLVSLKFFLSHLWFIAAAYFLAYEIFRRKRNFVPFFWAYMIPLSLVIFYTLFNQVQTGLVNQKAAHSAMTPFYNDHTSYGAILALFIPILTALLFLDRKSRKAPFLITSGFMVLFLFAFVFSYSRAAWLSLVVASGIALLIRLRIRLRTIALFSVILAGLLFSFWTTIWLKLEENKQESSTSFAQHITSMTNVRSDASNLERINRWKCALRMFEEKPFLGWGPGTYMFNYAPFQASYDRTIISTDFGDMGTAHSEYLGPLSESGLPGLITITAIFFLAFYTGVRVYRVATSSRDRTLALAILTGLSSYFIHGLMNNFLERDKAAIPFWGFLAILVTLDLYYKGKTTPPGKEAQ
jgi:O-antigen ligase